jgi:hypothetical protein
LGLIREVVEHGLARDRDDLVDARRVERDLSAPTKGRGRAPEGSSIRQRRRDYQIALIFVRDECCGQPGDAPDP